MVNIIVGKNYIDKTKVLQNMYESLQNSSATNLVGFNKAYCYNISMRKVELLRNCVALDEIKHNDKSITYAEYFYPANIAGQSVLDILSLLCKECDNIFIDQIERVMDGDCMKSIAQALCEFTCIGNIWITTYSVHFSNISGAKYYKVVDSSLVELTSREVDDYVDDFYDYVNDCYDLR